MKVQVGSQMVELVAPAKPYVWMWRQPAAKEADINSGLWKLAALGLCWGGPNRPAERQTPNNIYAYGRAVLDELLSRGAGFRQLEQAGEVAVMVMAEAMPGEPPDLDRAAATADFSEAPDESSTTS